MCYHDSRNNVPPGCCQRLLLGFGYLIADDTAHCRATDGAERAAIGQNITQHATNHGSRTDTDLLLRR